MDVSAGHKYSWFGRFCDASLSDASIVRQLTKFLTEMVIKLRSQLNLENANITDAEKRQIVKIRTQQNRFRRDVALNWDHKCAVTRIDHRELLRASHIRPWAESTRRQKTDASNGILLSPVFDALFDKGLITFMPNGKMKMSELLHSPRRLGIDPNAKLFRAPTATEEKYLQWHRRNVFVSSHISK